MAIDVKSTARRKTVPVEIIRGFKSYVPGDVAGFEETDARLLISKGFAVPIDPKTGAPVKPKSAQKAVVVDESVEGSDDLVDIPDDWQSIPFMSKLAIAKKIDDSIEGKEPFVTETIQAELDRRAAVSSPEGDNGSVPAPAGDGAPNLEQTEE